MYMEATRRILEKWLQTIAPSSVKAGTPRNRTHLSHIRKEQIKKNESERGPWLPTVPFLLLILFIEEILHFIEKAFFFWVNAFAAGIGELAKCFFLCIAQSRRHNNFDLDELVTLYTRSQVRNALALDAQDAIGLGSFRHLDGGLTIKSRHLDFSTQCSLDNADWHFAQDCRPIPFKELMALYIEIDIQVAGSTAAHPRFTLACHTESRTAVNASWNLDRNDAFLLYAACSTAVFAGIGNDLTRPMTSRTGTDINNLTKNGILRNPDFPRPVTIRTGFRMAAFGGSRSMAVLTFLFAVQADFLFRPKGRFLKGNFKVSPQIRALTGTAISPAGTGRACARTAEEHVEDIIHAFAAKATAKPPNPLPKGLPPAPGPPFWKAA